MSSEPDPIVEDLLTDKYDMVNDIRSRVMRTKPKTSDSTHTDGHEKTEELIKSFKVSLTMKPKSLMVIPAHLQSICHMLKHMLNQMFLMPNSALLF